MCLEQLTDKAKQRNPKQIRIPKRTQNNVLMCSLQACLMSISMAFQRNLRFIYRNIIRLCILDFRSSLDDDDLSMLNSDIITIQKFFLFVTFKLFILILLINNRKNAFTFSVTGEISEYVFHIYREVETKQFFFYLSSYL